MSLYVADSDVPAFRQKTYPSHRPPRSRGRQVPLPPVAVMTATLSNPTYQQFVSGEFSVDVVEMTSTA